MCNVSLFAADWSTELRRMPLVVGSGAQCEGAGTRIALRKYWVPKAGVCVVTMCLLMQARFASARAQREGQKTPHVLLWSFVARRFGCHVWLTVFSFGLEDAAVLLCCSMGVQ